MRIPEEKIDEVRSASDIVDVVSDYVRLKKRGSNFFGLCPFHSEKTPSFSVNPKMGIYKCFGCGEGGNVFSFISEIEGLSFPESVRLLAERAGIPMPEQEQDREAASETESVYHALRMAARFYYEQLTSGEEGERALAYLEERGFEPKTIKQFGLGYAPDSWDGLLKHAKRKHVEPEILEKAGLVIPRKKNDGHYDRFRGRVMFPILSHVGKVLGFGGRILDGEADQPKYINSPETRVYNKSRVLYGLYQGRHAIRRREEAILVEGYTDVIALHQAGVDHVVASSGTSLTGEHVSLLGRYAQRILLLFDADEAGLQAATRAITTVLEGGLAPYAIALPGGEDPDSFVRDRGAEAFRELVREERQDFVAFIYETARQSGELETPEGEAEVMRSIVKTIASIPDELMRETYLRRASEVLGIPDSRLYRVLEGFERDAPRRRQKAQPQRAPAEATPAPEAQRAPEPEKEPRPQEKLLLRLMLERGTPLVEYILGHMAADEFTEGASRSIVERLLKMHEEGKVDADHFLSGSESPAVKRLASEVLMDRHDVSKNWQLRKNIVVPEKNEDPYEAAASAMTILKMRRVDEALARERDRLYRLQKEAGEEEVRQSQERVLKLTQLRKHIRRGAFLNSER